MAAEVEIPSWLKSLPLAPEYRPTETEFADPIAFISRIEREAAAFGICKVIPPLPKPSKKFVLANLKRSLSASPDLDAPGPGARPSAAADADAAAAAVFTTRHQELGSRRSRTPVQKQVWQSGEFYTIEQFEAKSKAFARSQLGSGSKEVSPLAVEALFWKTAAEKPIYVEYANDVPGSGFRLPEEPLPYFLHRRRKRKKGFDRGTIQEPELPSPDTAPGEAVGNAGSAGWKLSNSPWNLQVIARAPGSLTRFMPDEVPGVTSPMVYIGMLFSWFAWHVEDHELHSLNFLHMGSPKTWYAVPGDYAATLEETFRVQAYGGNVDRLAALTLLGEKTTLLSPEVLVASGLPCCRLVQRPGEFVVTFPRAYHVGFSHGFNCGEAANFATPQWLKVAKEAAVRRAAMNYLPMLSHQQLLYMLTISFISSAPRELISGARSSRLRDRKKEETEVLVKKAFLDDMLREDELLFALLGRESTYYAVLWEPELLPSPCTASQPQSSVSLEAHLPKADDGHGQKLRQYHFRGKSSFSCKADDCFLQNAPEVTANLICGSSNNIQMGDNTLHDNCMSSQVEELQYMNAGEGNLPFGLNVDSGSLACVACGILGYPLMAILQPSEKAYKELFSGKFEGSNEEFSKSHWLSRSFSLPCTVKKLDSDLQEHCCRVAEPKNLDRSSNSPPENSNHNSLDEELTSVKEPFFHSADVSDVIDEMIMVKESRSDYHTGPANISDSFFPANSVSTEGHGQMRSMIENQINGVNIQKNNSVCASKDTRFDHHTRQAISDGMNVIAKSDMCITNISGQNSFNKEDRPVGLPEEKCCKETTEWNTSDNFLRPRIFCLQHALEIEELLHSKGGAHALIICHSDYLKIKALAISIAEEIDVQLSFKDVPLENASLSDLDLINISIDDEGHEEDGKDWTARLGLNLKYCVKLRKQTSSNQEHFALSLGGMFSDPSPSAVVANLKWLSRKPRTPYKVTGVIDENAEKTGLGMGGSNDSARLKKVYQNHEIERNGSPMKHHTLSIKGMPQESVNNNETMVIDYKADHIGPSTFAYMPKEKGVENTDDLLTIPVLFAEYPIRHQGGRGMHRVTTSSKTACSVEAGYFPVHVNLDLGVSKGLPEHHSNELVSKVTIIDPLSSCENQPSKHSGICHEVSEESSSKCELVSFKKSEADVLKARASSKSLRGESIHDGNNSHGESVGNATPTFGPICKPDKVPEKPKMRLMTVEAHFEDNLHRSSSFEDQLILPESSPSDPESKLEVITGDESLMDEMYGNPAKSNIEVDVSASEVNVKQGNVAAKESIIEGADMSINESQSVVDVSGVNSFELEGAPSVSKIIEVNNHVNFTSNTSTELSHSVANSMVESSNILEVIENAGHLNLSWANEGSSSLNSLRENNGNPPRVILIPYVRRRNKRKREDQEEQCESSSLCFIRSPCEGLRPRIKQITDAKADMSVLKKNSMVKTRRGSGNLDAQRDKCKGKAFKCDIEGCHMCFGTKGELSLHKHNRCTFEGCRKRFSSHTSAVRHQCVHNDERPLKCPWKGCNRTFKWAWARTEHIRLHTGERPYECKVSGCGQTFRFVSDFSRHRRRTGHYK